MKIAIMMRAHYEGFGLTLLEAMTCGCPVVASSTGACPEISGEAAILADPRNPFDFAEKIKLMSSDEALRNDCRAKGLERAPSFNWKKSAGNTILVLEESIDYRKREIHKSPHRVLRTI